MRNYLRSVRKIFFDYFYTYDEFGITIHHLSRIINENRPVKILFENDNRLVLSFAEYTILQLLFADINLYYNETKPMNTTEIFPNGIFQDISRVSDYRLNLPKEFTIKRTETSFLVMEGDNLKFKIVSGMFHQSIQALYQRPIPKIGDIPIRPYYEKEIVSKIRSNELGLYIFNFDIQIEYKNSKIESIRSRIRRNSRFSDKVDLITNLIRNLRERTSVSALIERIYQRIEEDRLEGFFENERKKQQ